MAIKKIYKASVTLNRDQLLELKEVSLLKATGHLEVG